MAIAVVQEFAIELGNRGTENYDGLKAQLNMDADPPAGLILHAAGFSGTGLFRIFGVWESEEDWQRFNTERFMPAMAPLSERPGAPPSVQFTYELHDVVRG
jgi:hypothetical protein